MTRRLSIAAAEAWVTVSLLAVAVWAVVAPALTADEDAHDADCVGPCCDPGPDDLEVYEAAIRADLNALRQRWVR